VDRALVEAPSGNLARVVDARGCQKHPAGARSDGGVQVVHPAVLPQKGSKHAVLDFGTADDLRSAIDIECGARRIVIAQGAEVFSVAASPDNSVGGAVGQITGTDNFALVIESLGTAESTSRQLRQAMHLPAIPGERVRSWCATALHVSRLHAVVRFPRHGLHC
jgi:hypothetical protein